MKKKVVSALLCATMVATMFAGCGSKESDNNASTPDTSKADTSSEVSEPAEDTGKVLNIYCWNEEFKSRITAHYPDYKEVDATHGKIGDVDVVWNITPNDDNAYQNNLDATLLNQADAPADDKIDLFLVEADYALKYVDTDYTMPIKDLGITDDDLSKQYQYTKDIVTDSNGVLKGLSWQGCPGVLFYNRDAAKEVLGTDDPDKVQESVKDWDTYNDTAKKMKDAGYKMTASANDTYRVYSNNVTSKWVDGNKISIDDNIMKWVDDSKAQVLNIYCWNEEFKSRITAHYPDYKEVDATHGKIGDVDVVWNITPNDDNAYQNNLDATLLNQADAPADDKIDLFLVEADYALKYVDTDYTMPIKDLGITDDDLSKQYQYTKDIVTDSNGVLKGLSWQGCPGVLFYNRDAAKEVLGTDDPDKVQESVKDWDTYNDTAKKMKDAGYKMTASANDTYRVYSNNVTSKWVDGNKISIDDNIMKWVDDSKAQVDAGETGTCDLWSDDWSKGFYPQGKVFCYFGPAWLVNFSMAADTEGSIGYNGGWGAAQGPQGFFWGGTWICAAQGTDNANLVKDIMLKMTTDDDIMKDIVVDDDDFVNNSTVMNGMADGSIKVKDNKEYSSKILGGQNPLPMYCAGVETLDLSNLSSYDQGCNEEFQNAMKNYFEGKATKDEALDLFYKAVTEKYPELTY